jgi:hypothetical protein
MLEETKTIIELAYRFAKEIRTGLRDITSAGLDDFFKCLYYDPDAKGWQSFKPGAYYKLLKTVSREGGNGSLKPMQYHEGVSYTAWAVDPLEVGGNLNQILITFDGTSKQFLIENGIVRIIDGEPVSTWRS